MTYSPQSVGCVVEGCGHPVKQDNSQAICVYCNKRACIIHRDRVKIKGNTDRVTICVQCDQVDRGLVKNA